MGNKLQVLFILFLTLLTLIGCNNQSPNNSDINTNIDGTNRNDTYVDRENLDNTSNNSSNNEISESLYFTFDGYGEAGGSLAVTELSLVGSTEVSESISWSFEATENAKIQDMLNDAGVVAINPTHENDTFEGWIIFKEVISLDEKGYEVHEFEKISEDKLYTTNELFDMSMPNYNVIYVAKWSSVPMNEYYKEGYLDDPVMDTTYFSLYANGGTMIFSDVETKSFELERYNYWLNEGESLKDVMNGDIVNSAILKSVQKDDFIFTGWTVYSADSLNWSSDEVIEEGTQNFLYDPNDDDFRYMYLENCVLYSENASTEEITKITYNGKHYYAFANWEPIN